MRCECGHQHQPGPQTGEPCPTCACAYMRPVVGGSIDPMAVIVSFIAGCALAYFIVKGF